MRFIIKIYYIIEGPSLKLLYTLYLPVEFPLSCINYHRKQAPGKFKIFLKNQGPVIAGNRI